MQNPTRLTPSEAQARFGELVHWFSRTHQYFDAPEGRWRPEFDMQMKLESYRLYPTPTPSSEKPEDRLFKRKRRKVASDDDATDIGSKLGALREHLEALEDGRLHLGAPSEGRTEAKMTYLRGKISMYESILRQREDPMGAN